MELPYVWKNIYYEQWPNQKGPN